MHAPPFSALASVYDAIMSDIEHDHWAEFVLTYLESEGLEAKEVLDLACGTGLSSLPFWQRGLVVTGLDGSPDMLARAQERLPEATLLLGDLRDFKVAQQAGEAQTGAEKHFCLVTCLFDSLNNLLSEAELLACFRRVRAHLRPKGVFTFDVNTPKGVRELWDEDTLEGVAQLEGGGEVYYRWQHEYDPVQGLGLVQAYCRAGEQEFIERHAERGYDAATLLPLLEQAGFERAEALEYPDYAPPEADAPRIWVFAHAGAS